MTDLNILPLVELLKEAALRLSYSDKEDRQLSAEISLYLKENNL